MRQRCFFRRQTENNGVIKKDGNLKYIYFSIVHEQTQKERMSSYTLSKYDKIYKHKTSKCNDKTYFINKTPY